MVLSKASSSKKLIATTDYYDEGMQQSFVKNRGFNNINYVQIREYLVPGETYDINIFGSSKALEFMTFNYCTLGTFKAETFPMSSFKYDLELDSCQAPIVLAPKLEFQKHTSGTLSYDIGKIVLDTTYFRTDD